MNVKRYGEHAELIWKDRKRYFGLPWSFTRYSLVKNGDEWYKLFTNIGLLSTIADEINLYRIRDISLHQSLADKIFRTGTVILYSNDERHPELHLRHIAKPYVILDLLSAEIEEQRKKYGVHIAEFQN